MGVEGGLPHCGGGAQTTPSTPAYPVETVDAPSEGIIDVLDALQKLPRKQRAAVVLRHSLGYTPREIAAILEVAPPTARVHIARGLKRLRTLLKEADDET
jgi:DNA-directed RNA polymerase specialized sigma24 family protein